MCKKIIIKNEKMAGWLMFNGFHKLFEESDLEAENMLIYIFKDTEKIRGCMAQYNQYKQSLSR